jgi:hypothetical protein
MKKEMNKIAKAKVEQHEKAMHGKKYAAGGKVKTRGTGAATKGNKSSTKLG